MRRFFAIFCLSGLALAETDPPPAPGDRLFDRSMLHEIRLYVHPRDWARLKEYYFDNTYYPAAMLWRGEYIEGIGVRSRGRGSRSPVKPGLRVDFDRYEPEQRFEGLKSIVLDNLWQDPPMTRERLAMLLFERMGIAAPRVTHTRLYVNDEYTGVYAIVESIDKNFLRRTLKDDEGYLYEYKQMDDWDMSVRAGGPSKYVPEPFDPKTHEKNPKPEAIEEFVRTINETPDGDFERVVGEYLDWDHFLTYLAVESFAGERDGFLREGGVNNFYLYRFDGTKRFQLIPWDKDATFVWSEQPVLEGVEGNVLVRRALAAPALKRKFLEALAACAESAEAGDWLAQEADRILGMIHGAVEGDPNRRDPMEIYEQAREDLLYFIRQRARFVRDEVAALMPVE
jgi:spore coat protein H